MRVGGQDHHHSNLQTCPFPLSNYTGEVYNPFKDIHFGSGGSEKHKITNHSFGTILTLPEVLHITCSCRTIL